MARVRAPLWLPSSAWNWLFCNFIGAGIFEAGFAVSGIPWPATYPATTFLGAILLVTAALRFMGRTAYVDYNQTITWRPARLPEPGEPPPGNRLAWPAADDVPARVATSPARALTVRKRHAPKDRGEGPAALIVAPMLGFVAAVPTSIFLAVAGSDAVWLVWGCWGALVWACITAGIVLKTRRLNEDA